MQVVERPRGHALGRGHAPAQVEPVVAEMLRASQARYRELEHGDVPRRASSQATVVPAMPPPTTITSGFTALVFHI
jgi:hypothetical protein